MTKVSIDAEAMARAYWPGLHNLIKEEMLDAINKDLKQIADNYYHKITFNMERKMGIEKAEYVDGKLIITIKV